MFVRLGEPDNQLFVEGKNEKGTYADQDGAPE
jgi:hypothetical protein